MDVQLQTKLLRFLQTSLIQPIGGNELREVDVRVICATNRDPMAEVRAGRFREDLYYRLNVLPIALPPLRDRGDDILQLARTFLRAFAAEEHREFEDFDAQATALLAEHRWPGNVRELQNAVRNIVVLNQGTHVTAPMVQAVPGFGEDPQGQVTALVGASNAAPLASGDAEEVDAPTPIAARAGYVPLGGKLRDIERQVIEGTLDMVDGSVPQAAKILGVSPSTLYRKLEGWNRHAS